MTISLAPGAGRGPWRFRDVESLWNALERYHFYHESCRVRSLWVGDGGGFAMGIEMTDQWAVFTEANRAIDQALARMRLMDPKLHLLLHLEQAVVLLWGLHRMPARAWSMTYRALAPADQRGSPARL